MHAHRRPRPLLPRPHAPRRLARAQRQPVGCRGEDRRDPPRGVGPRQLGADVADLLPFAAGSGVRERRATRTPAAAPRSRPWLRHRQPQLHHPRLCRDRPLPPCRDGRDQARGQPPRDRPAARPDLRAGSDAGRAGAPPRVAAPAARLAGAGGVGRRRARRTGRAPSGCTLYSRSHRRWRGLAALARGTADDGERVCRSLGERGGRGYAGSVPRGRGSGAAAVGHGPDHGHPVGQAALPRAPAVTSAAGARQVEERGAYLPPRRVPRRRLRMDVNAFLGAYPYARVPGTAPDRLVEALERVDIDEAWGSHPPRLFWRQPMDGNAWLYDTVARERRLRPVPAVHPGLAGWAATLAEAADHGAPAVRCDPSYYGLDPTGPEGPGLAAARRAAGPPPMMAGPARGRPPRPPNAPARRPAPPPGRALVRHRP